AVHQIGDLSIKSKYVLIVYPISTFRIPPAYIIFGVIYGVNHFYSALAFHPYFYSFLKSSHKQDICLYDWKLQNFPLYTHTFFWLLSHVLVTKKQFFSYSLRSAFRSSSGVVIGAI